jgi:metal-responsive CopG/Arc/MetJ family transcriptional regulator
VPLVLPRTLLARINEAASREGINRSEFIRRAIQRILAEPKSGEITPADQ